MTFQPVSSVGSSKLHQMLTSTNWSLHCNQNAYKNDKTIYTQTEKKSAGKNLIGGKRGRLRTCFEEQGKEIKCFTKVLSGNPLLSISSAKIKKKTKPKPPNLCFKNNLFKKEE